MLKCNVSVWKPISNRNLEKKCEFCFTFLNFLIYRNYEILFRFQFQKITLSRNYEKEFLFPVSNFFNIFNYFQIGVSFSISKFLLSRDFVSHF